MIAYSSDGGMSFSPNVPVTDGIFPLLPDPNGWMGEYIGIDVDSAAAYIAWTDTRLADRDIYFDSLAQPVGIPMDHSNRGLPIVFSLSQNYPNPCTRMTTISYALPKDCHVRIDIYNIVGQRVVNLVDEDEKAGRREVRLNADLLPAGVYFYRLEAGDFSAIRKLTIIR